VKTIGATANAANQRRLEFIPSSYSWPTRTRPAPDGSLYARRRQRIKQKSNVEIAKSAFTGIFIFGGLLTQNDIPSRQCFCVGARQPIGRT
jgi:hypothetical protein